MSPNFISAVGLILFLGVFFKYGYPRLSQIFNARIAVIKQALEDAHHAKEAALTTLHAEHRKQTEVAATIEFILKRAQEEADTLKKTAFHDLEALMTRRRYFVQQGMERMKYQAIQEIKEYVSRMTVETVNYLLQNKTTAAEHEELNQRALQNISRILTTTASQESEASLSPLGL